MDTLVIRDHLPLGRPYVAPRTPTETIVAEIWREVLGMDRVGVEDHYSDLGGDSFMASVIFSLLEPHFGPNIPMAFLVTSPTVAALAVKLEALGAGRGG